MLGPPADPPPRSRHAEPIHDCLGGAPLRRLFDREPRAGRHARLERDPGLDAQIADRVVLLGKRYRRLKRELKAVEGRLTPYPFNSGCFALVRVPGGLDAHDARRALIADHDVGSIAIPEINALRVAYCSLAEDMIPELVQRLVAVLDG